MTDIMTAYRKTIAAGFLLFSICFSLPSGALAETGAKADLVLAYPAKLLIDVDMSDANVAMKIYAAELARGTGYTADSYIYDSLERVVKEIRENRVDVIIFSSLDYFRIKNGIDAVLALGHLRGGKSSVKYLLLTHQSRGYTGLGDLRNKKLLMPKEDDIAALFLNTILLKQKYGEMKNFFSSVEEKKKSSQTVLPVFFGQADACITTDVALKTMVEMNPQLGRDLKVLVSSPELTTSVGVFRRTLDDDIREKTWGVARSLKNNARGRQVLMLFKIEDLVNLKESDLTSVKDLMNEYERLKRKR